MKIYWLFAASVCCLPIVTQGQSLNNTSSASINSSAAPDTSFLQNLLQAKKPDLTFKPDDVISVQIYGIETYAEKQRVSEDGTIIFPLIGKTQVAGLTTAQVQQSIARALAENGMIKEAQVSITSELRPTDVVSVLGNVNRPGTFPAQGNLTIADYISQAAGFIESGPGTQPSSSAASYTVTLTRPGLSAPVRVPLSPRLEDSAWARIPVFAGDQIRVDKIGVIYAVGAFRLQGGYPLKNTDPTTVSQLVALAGGIGYEAASGESHIVRRDQGAPRVITINVSRILKGTEPDQVLQPDDILFVPTNKLKAAIKGGGPSIIVSLASAALFSR